MHRNAEIRFWRDPNKMMIKRCLIIPIKQHQIYYNGVDTKLRKGLHDVRSPEYVLDLAMCYAELKIIVEKTPTCTS